MTACPRLSRQIGRLPHRLTGDRPSLTEITQDLSGQGAGLLMFFAALVALVPTPGIPVGMVTGSLLVVLACREMLGLPPRALPGRLGRVAVARPQVRAVTRRMIPWVRRLENWSRPRLSALTGRVALPLLAGIIAVQGVLIALPIPFGNTAPGIASALIALAWLTRDGLAVGLGLLVAMGWVGALIGIGIGGLTLI